MDQRDISIITQTSAKIAAELLGPGIAQTDMDLDSKFQEVLTIVASAIHEEIAVRLTTTKFEGAAVLSPAAAPAAPAVAAPPPPSAPPVAAAPPPAPAGTPAPAAMNGQPMGGHPEAAAWAQFFEEWDRGNLQSFFDNRTYQGQPSNTPHFKHKATNTKLYINSKFPRKDDVAYVDDALAQRGLK